MTEHRENDANDRPTPSVAGELERLRRRVAELECREAEHRLAEKTLAQEQEHFRLFYEQCPLGYQSLDADGRIRDVNPAWLAILGYERDAVLGRWFGDFLTPEFRGLFPDRFARFKETGVVHGVQFDMLCRDGRSICVEFDGRISYTTAGDFSRTHCVMRDVTERRRNEESLRTSEERLRRLIENLPDGVFVHDLQGRIVMVNRAACENTGYSRDELLAMGVGDVDMQENVEQEWSRFWSSLGADQTVCLEREHRRKDGTTYPAELHLNRFDLQGQPVIVGIARDVTEQRLAREALRKNEEKYRRLVETVNEGVWAMDADHKTTYVNPRMAAMLGYAEDQMLGRPVEEFMFQEDLSAHGERMQTRHAGRDGRYEHRFRRRDGGEVWTLVSATAFTSPEGRFDGSFAMFTDITDRKQAEESLLSTHRIMTGLLEAVPDLLIVIDRNFRILYTNAKGHDRIEPCDLHECQTCYGRFKLLHQPCEDCSAQPVFETGQILEREMVNPADGRLREVRAFPIRNAAGDVTAVVEHIRDIDDRRRAEETLAQQRAELQAVYDHSPVMMCVLKSDRRVLYANRAFAEFTGVPEEELRAGRACGVFGCINALTDPRGCGYGHDCEQCAVRLAIEDTLRTGVSHHDIEYRATLEHRGARREIVLLAATARVEANGRSNLLLCLQDITKRRRAERALRESEERFRAVFEQAPDSIVLIDSATAQFVEFNQRAHEILGYTREEFGRLTVADVEACESHEEVLAHIAEVLRHGKDSFRSQHRTKDGRLLDIEASTRVLSLRGRHLLVCIWTDITERRRAERLVQQTTKLLGAIKDAQNLYIGGADAKDVYQALLRTLVTITDSEYGFLDEVLRDESGQLYKRSLAISDISWDEESRRLYREHLQRGLEFHDLNNLAGLPALTGRLVISNRPDQDSRSRGIPKGHPPLRAFMGVPIYFGGQILGVAGVANRLGRYDEQVAEFLEPFMATCAGIIHAVQNDAKEREHREALRENHANLLAILEGTDDMVASRDRAGGLVFCNSAFARMVRRLFGVEAEPGLRTLDHLPAAQREHWERILARVLAGEPYRGEFEWDHGDQDLRFYEISFHPIRKGDEIIGTVEYNRDITERRRLQRQAEQRQVELFHVSRLSTLGEMASGIAHELNQPLTSILSFGEACRRRLQEQPPDLPLIVEYLGKIVSQGERAGLIIRRMRALAKGLQPQFAAVDLAEVIQNAVGMSQWELKQNEIQLIQEIAESLLPVYADAIQIEQVLLNLIRNSMDAMRRVKDRPRRLTIRARGLDDKHVRVEVCDSGIGLPPGTEDRVFDPFFTSKPDGLGIGLSISRSIIESHRGTIEAKANPDHGATFFFTLPMSHVADQRGFS